VEDFFISAAFVVAFFGEPVDRVAAAFVVALAIGGAVLGERVPDTTLRPQEGQRRRSEWVAG
jgi:hypothetical protein